jgi:hypothetical protein
LNSFIPTPCEENPFTRYRAPPPPPDPFSTLALPSCSEELDLIANSVGSITSQRYYFWSEIQEIIEGTVGEKLPCFLREVRDRQHSGSSFNVDNATLIIDIACSLSEPIIIPERFTIAGTGLDGDGKLTFQGLQDGVSAIQLDDKGKENKARNITLRDIRIAGEGFQPYNIGVDVSRASKLYIKNCEITDFHTGLFGGRPTTSAISVYIDQCNIYNNSWNVVMYDTPHHWRIRDCILSQANCSGLRIFSGNDHLISGCRIEDCGENGAKIGPASDAIMFMNNRFEQNGGVGGVGIQILPTTLPDTDAQTRLVSNYFSSNRIEPNNPLPPGTQEWGSIFV